MYLSVFVVFVFVGEGAKGERKEEADFSAHTHTHDTQNALDVDKRVGAAARLEQRERRRDELAEALGVLLAVVDAVTEVVVAEKEGVGCVSACVRMRAAATVARARNKIQQRTTRGTG